MQTCLVLPNLLKASVQLTKYKPTLGKELASPNKKNYRHSTAPSKMVRPFVLNTRNATETKYNKK